MAAVAEAELGFAGLLRQLRAEARLTQEELAEAASLSPQAVAALERGVHRTAHKDTAALLADALGLPEQVRTMFVAAARGKAPAADVLAAREALAPGAFAAAARPLPNNLPAQPAAFIGRDRELSEVRALVESCRLVTLTGAGGCGKTRLGLQLAAGLLDGSGDGVWLVELAAVSNEDAVAPAICAAAGIARHPGRPVLEALLDALAPQQVLIVLDNCEHLIGGCAKTADAILRRCRRVRLVATSREPLGIGGETIYRVPPLSLPRPGDTGVLAV
jgi:non-specific serine/threonine protein kinase